MDEVEEVKEGEGEEEEKEGGEEDEEEEEDEILSHPTSLLSQKLWQAGNKRGAESKE